MHQKHSSRVRWMVFLGIYVSQMPIARASPVTASIIAPSTTMGNYTGYPSVTLTSTSSENSTLYASTWATNTATYFVVENTAVDPRTTLGNETTYSPSIISTSSKGSFHSSPLAPESTQLTTAEYYISTAQKTNTRFDAQMTSSVRESPALTLTTENTSPSKTTSTLKTTSTPETTLTPHIASTAQIISTTGTSSNQETISTPETTSTTGTTSTPKATSTTETLSTPEITSTPETTSTTQCTYSTTTKTPKKDCVIDDADFLDQLRKELIADEGYKEEIYKDTKGNPTFGIGHKITPNDPEYGKPLGTKVSKERIEEAYKADVKAAIESCCKIFDDFQNLPSEVQLIILNMAFNLGEKRLRGFKKFRKAVNNGDWEKAADEMVDSKWYKKDVPNRAKRLEERMRKVAKMY